MAAAPVIAAVIAAGASIYSSEQQASIAKDAERSRRDQQSKLEAERQKQMQNSEIELQRNVEKSKKQTAASTAGGRADTILTSPLGIVGGEQSAAKTLLGS